jgi:hypothetical protein
MGKGRYLMDDWEYDLWVKEEFERIYGEASD